MKKNPFISKYKKTSIYGKLALIASIGLCPGIWVYCEKAEVFEIELNAARLTRDAAKRRLEKAKIQKADLPMLENQLVQAEAELADGSKKLPDKFTMGQILQKASLIAQESGVNLNHFEPRGKYPSGGDFKYVERPISLELIGTYAQIATFLTKIVRLDILVHIQNLEMKISRTSDPRASREISTSKSKSTKRYETRLLRKKRSTAKLVANADMVVFRALTPREESAIENSKTKGNTKK